MKLPIGKISKLFNISSDTLRHYDKIGLLKPYVDKHNSYRYYTQNHIEQLSIILLTKELGIGLSDIKNTIESESLDEYKKLIERQESTIDEKINELKRLKVQIEEAKKMFDELEEFDKEDEFSKIKFNNENYEFYVINVNEIFRSDFYNEYVESVLNYCSDTDIYEEEFFYKYKISDFYRYDIQDFEKVEVDKESIIEENEEIMYLKKNSYNVEIIEKIIETTGLNTGNENLQGKIAKIKFSGTPEDLEEYIINLKKYFKDIINEVYVNYLFYLPRKNESDIYFVEILIKK